MKLEEMKKIAEARTKGEWMYASTDHTDGLSTTNIQHLRSPHGIISLAIKARAKQKDWEFIAMAANTFDVLLEIAELAKNSDLYAFKKLVEKLDAL